MTNKFFRFTPDGFYEGDVCAAVDPLETKKAGRPVYIQPCSATDVEPEKKDGFWPRWQDGAWTYVRLPKTVDELIEFGGIKHDQTTGFWRRMNAIRTELVQANERCKSELQDGYWIVSQLPEPTPEEILERQAQEIRSKRDYLISKTDFLVAGDYPISDDDLEAVKAYRQALRDVPTQEGFPDSVVWPEEPEYTVLRS